MSRPFLRVALAIALIPACSAPRDAVRIVGSSTVFPFSRTVAERAAVKFDDPAPIVEMTGTGGGIQQFCRNEGGVDIANASRAMKMSERALCAQNGVNDVVEFRIGFDGIVVAAAPHNRLRNLTLGQLYRAVAKDLPAGGGFAPNPHRLWSDVDPALPPIAIEVHGSPPTSGTRDAFVELALQAGAKTLPELAALAETDEAAFRARGRIARGWALGR